ncbi:hypothetical protein D3C71_1988260 [compost metagenome]
MCPWKARSASRATPVLFDSERELYLFVLSRFRTAKVVSTFAESALGIQNSTLTTAPELAISVAAARVSGVATDKARLSSSSAAVRSPVPRQVT